MRKMKLKNSLGIFKNGERSVLLLMGGVSYPSVARGRLSQLNDMSSVCSNYLPRLLRPLLQYIGKAVLPADVSVFKTPLHRAAASHDSRVSIDSHSDIVSRK